MKTLLSSIALTLVMSVAAVAHEGCEKAGSKAQAVPKKGLCAPCVVKEGRRNLEAVKAHLSYRGKLMTFCSPKCKAEFINSPAKYAKVVP